MENESYMKIGPKIESLTEIEANSNIVENKSSIDLGAIVIIIIIIAILGNIIYQSLNTYKDIQDKRRRIRYIVLRIILCIALCIFTFILSIYPLVICGMTGECSEIGNILALVLPILIYFLIAFIPIGKKTWF